MDKGYAVPSKGSLSERITMYSMGAPLRERQLLIAAATVTGYGMEATLDKMTRETPDLLEEMKRARRILHCCIASRMCPVRNEQSQETAAETVCVLSFLLEHHVVSARGFMRADG